MNRHPERMESLDPRPSAIVKFIHTVAEKPWPSAQNEFHNYFEHLGCELGPADYHDSETPLGVTRGACVIRHIKTKNASWMALDGSLFSLNFFAYENEEDVAAAVSAGYDGVRSDLISLYGEPVDERLPRHDNRSAAWLVMETEIELYAHVSLAPVLQIGLGHKQRNTVYEHRLARQEQGCTERGYHGRLLCSDDGTPT